MDVARPENNLPDRINSIWKIIESGWSELSMDSEFSEFILLVLQSARRETQANSNITKWGTLPGLCCQAAGGEASRADTIAAAWLLFYMAADIMDSVQDQDAPAGWWKDRGPGAALSAATGLFFYASWLLNRTSYQEITENGSARMIEGFYHSFLNMSSGQYSDLLNPEPTLDLYWKIAAAKSGAFFSLACKAGASLATNNHHRIEHFRLYGENLGVLIQIYDDFEDLNLLVRGGRLVQMGKILRTLPVVYAIQVLPDSKVKRLRHCLRNADKDPANAEEAQHVIEQSGAVLYLLAEIERFKQNAVDHINQAEAVSPAKEALISSLINLGTNHG